MRVFKFQNNFRVVVKTQCLFLLVKHQLFYSFRVVTVVFWLTPYTVHFTDVLSCSSPMPLGEMPWVGNEAGRLNEMRDSLGDDFYPGQDSVQRAGADSDISTRTTLSVSFEPFGPSASSSHLLGQHPVVLMPSA